MNRGKREDPLERIRKGQAQAAEERQKLLERMRASQRAPKPVASAAPARPPRPFDNLDIEAAMAAAGRLRLMTLTGSAEPPAPPNRPTAFLLEEFLRALVSGESTSILQWPFGQRDVSFVHPIAMLALLCTPERQRTGNFYWCKPPHTLRTLYYPWRGGATSASQGSILVRRNEILEWNRYHLTRTQVQPSAPRVLVDYLHTTLGHLNALSARDQTKPHLAHPTLAEIYPTFIADGGDPPPRPFSAADGELLGRVRHGASLDQGTDYRSSICVPASAPYGLFGVSSTAQPKHALAATALTPGRDGRFPDICILDLGPPALNRLGHNWKEMVEVFIAEVNKRFPDLPVMSVTQDSFAHRHVSSLLRTEKSKNPQSRVLVRLSRDPLSADPAIEIVSETEVEFSVVSGPVADAVAALSEAARGSSDSALAGTLRREMGSLRKAASLPCGLGPAYELLCAVFDQFQAESFLQFRSPATLLAPLEEALASEVGGAERARLVHARDAVKAAFDTLHRETPIGSLLNDLGASLLRRASRTVVAFATDIDRVLGEHRLADDSDTGQAMRRRLEKGHVLLTHAEELETKLAAIERGRDRNTWKRLVVIAPNLDWLSTIAARSWLPDELLVLCERTLASRVAETFGRMSSHADLAGPGKIGARLESIAQAAKTEVAARGVTAIELELEPRSIDTNASEVIDLTDDDADDGDEIIELILSSGRRIRARPGSTIIRYDQHAELNPFEKTNAADVRERQSVVVPDNAFIIEAREVLPIQVLAQSWVEVYHSTVEASLQNIEGDSLNAKARQVLRDVRARGARTQTAGAVLSWLKVEEYKQLPAEKRQSHAPQRRREFDAFMSVLGVNESVAEKMWMEGIQPLRIDRRRAGQRMAQAFVSVLVEPHGTTSHFSAPVREGIRALRKKALDHLDRIVEVKMIDRREVQ